MGKFQNRLKLTVHLLPNLCRVLLGLIGKVDLRQRIRRWLYLEQCICQCLERLAILPIVGHQHVAVLRFPSVLPLMSPHKAL